MNGWAVSGTLPEAGYSWPAPTNENCWLGESRRGAVGPDTLQDDFARRR
jgi:hypothetical protein